MDGVPIFSTWRGGMEPGGARLVRFRGALNSTTSVVLSGMERGETMEQALQAAKDAGIAEADPTGDLSGMDAAVKVVALAVALELGSSPLRLEEVAVSGVQHVTSADVAAAQAEGKKLRLVGSAELVEVSADQGTESCIGAEKVKAGEVKACPEKVKARQAARGYVRVEALEPGDPLYGLDGADAAVTLYTDRLAPVTIMQKGSVVEDTAFGEFADIMRACRPLAV
uniref:Homoserine dehydrogenase n=1 Tax=Haptolina ericina TaxID=156174 RepID=A0A7S3B5K5_9EUKA